MKGAIQMLGIIDMFIINYALQGSVDFGSSRRKWLKLGLQKKQTLSKDGETPELFTGGGDRVASHPQSRLNAYRNTTGRVRGTWV